MTDRPTIRCAYFQASHGQLHYRSNERQDLAPLLLLHQTPSDSRMYAALMEELAGYYWLIAPDNPGFGNSEPLPEGFSMPGCADAIGELLDGLGVQRCRVFGHHTGAAIAVQLVDQRPALATALVLGGPPLLDAALREALPGSAAPFAESPDGAHLLAMWERMSRKEGDTPAAVLLREVCAAFAAGDSYPQAYAAVVEQPFAEQLAALDCPTLAFAGTRDILYDRLKPSLALLHHGSMREIQGAGGYVCDRQPEIVAALLREFFALH
jgi:pimeloyl-ACP methyl ester carboxylesterase